MGTSRVYAVASGKGGVGKTTSVVNLGAGFAEAGRSVVVVDVDLGMANLGDVLDVSDDGATLHDVLAGDADLEGSLRSAPGGFDAIVGTPTFEAFGKADTGGLGPLVADLRDRYDVVLLDTGAGLNYDAALPLGLADEVVLVSTPDAAAVNNTETTRDLVERLDGEVAGVILNRVGGAAGRPPDDLESRLGVRVLGSVPEDSGVADSAETGTPVVVSDRSGPAAQSFREIAYAILDEPLPMDWSDRDETAGMAGSPVGATDDSASEESAGADDTSEDADVLEAGAAESDPEHPESEATGDDADGTSADDPEDPPAADDDSADDDAESTGPGLADAIESAESDPAAGTSLGGAIEENEDPALTEGPIDDAEAEDDDDSRSLLSKVTGGLFG